MWSMSEGIMHVRVSHQSQCGLYQQVQVPYERLIQDENKTDKRAPNN